MLKNYITDTLVAGSIKGNTLIVVGYLHSCFRQHIFKKVLIRKMNQRCREKVFNQMRGCVNEKVNLR